MLARLGSLLLALLILTSCVRAEDGHDAWLRNAPLTDPTPYASLPSLILTQPDDPVTLNAAAELQHGLSAMLGRPFHVQRSPSPSANSPTIVLSLNSSLPAEQYHIDHSGTHLTLIAGTPPALLYAVFHLLQSVATLQPIPAHFTDAPAAPIRWTDEWDNPDGTIERGYAGQSIFFAQGHVRQDLGRVAAYARLLASIGINGCNINNVNADLQTLTIANLRDFARVAAAFRPWGVHLALSIDLTSPQTVGSLPTFDPLDPTVIRWWQQKVDEIYTLIPDFAGFTVKADSEGRKGPAQYGRSPADAANVLARALAPHHGVVLYRGFVYNNHLDWQDPKADRARAGVDNFARYDGAFEPNVIIQIKEGPIDFQAREPVSPLFAALPHTNVAIELQTTQEYTGQQRHLVWLPAMWKWVLDTDLRVPGSQGQDQPSTVSQIVTGQRFPLPSGQPRPGGFVSVTNVGTDANWLHHPMAMANLYGFGRLAWNPATPLAQLRDTWTRLTWGNDPQVVDTVSSLLAGSWQTYEGYTGPNGMGTLTNILGVHFGPGIESAERNGWGQWFRGDHDGIGMDRSAAGTGYAQQYPPKLAAQYNNPATTPDDLLLFFHHVPYTWRLHSGKTLIQSIYDTHYAAALTAARYVPRWQTLQAKIDPERYLLVLDLFTYQAGHAIVWRDAICNWFNRISTIPDQQVRVGQHPNRIEAESMQSAGYTSVEITPWETASAGKAAICKQPQGCTLSTTLQHPAGRYAIAVQYFDLRTGVSRYTLRLNGKQIAAWRSDASLPPAVVWPFMDGQTSTRFTLPSVELRPGDRLELGGIPDLHLLQTASCLQDASSAPPSPTRADARELAPVDYIDIGPAGLTPQ